MREKMIRIMSVLLCLVVLLSNVPMMVFATETSGSCGSFSRWSFDSATGTLTISGQYQINDYDEYDTPWCKAGLDAKITKVIIEEGITIVGAYAFDGVENLETVYLPKSLTTIDEGAFRINRNGDPVIKDVYYAGTKTLWNEISISQKYNENECLLYATAFHYAYLCTEGHTWVNDTSNKTCSVCGATEAYKNYNLWVYGYAVSEKNAADVKGDGTVSYDAENNVLYLNNALINRGIKDGDGHYCAIRYTGTEPLIISASGNNTINTVNKYMDDSGHGGSYGIYSTTDLTLTGDGYLYIRGCTAIKTEGKLRIGENFDQPEQKLSLHLQANSVASYFATATKIYYPIYSKDEDGETEYDDYYGWRTNLSGDFSSDNPGTVTSKTFEIKGGSGHAVSYEDNGDRTHKVKCACGEVLIAEQTHEEGTSCICGIAQASVNDSYQYGYYGNSYRNLHEAIKAASNTAGTQTVHIGTMSLTEDATLASDDRMNVGSYYSSGQTFMIDGATFTLSAGSTFVISKNTITCSNGGRAVDLGATILEGPNITQHSHYSSWRTWKYTDNGDGTHSRTYDCPDCGITYYDGSAPASHGDWENGVCGDCGAVCAHCYESGMCMLCGEVCGHETFGEDGKCTVCGIVPAVKVTYGDKYFYYATIDAAMEAIPTDDTEATLTLLTDATTGITVKTGMDLLFDGGDYSLTVTSGNAITVNGGALEVVGGVVQGVRNGIYNNGGTVTVSGGEVKATGTDACGIYNSSSGGVTVSGTGKVTGGAYGVYNYYQYGTVIVSGGTLTGTAYALYNFAGSRQVSLSGGIFIGGIYASSGSSTTAPTVENLLKRGYQYQMYTVESGAGSVYNGASKVSTKENLIITCAHSDLSYSASGATISAVCANEKCDQYNSVVGTYVISASGKTYDGRVLTAAVAGTGAFKGAAMPTVTYTWNDVELDGTPVDAGVYTASITIDGAAAVVNFEIGKKSIDAALSGAVTKTYDGNTTVPSDHGLEIILNGHVAADDVSVEAEFAYAAQNVGEGIPVIATGITLTGEDADNYILVNTTASAAVGTIVKAVPELGQVTAKDLVDTRDITKVEITCNNTEIAGTFKIDDDQTLKYGENTVSYTFTPDNGNYETVSGVVIVFVKRSVCDGENDCPGTSYSDVDTSEWYHEAVDFVVENGYMQGYSSEIFGSDDTLTRAQMVQILYNMEGAPAVTGENGYIDTRSGEWYAQAVLWATQMEIVNGFPDGSFRPDENLTREQMVTILYRYSKLKDYDLTESSYSQFSDASAVAGYAEAAMGWAVGKGIIEGMEDGTLCPVCQSTRAQVATVIRRFMELFVP